VYSANSVGNVTKFGPDGTMMTSNIMSTTGPSKPNNMLIDPFGDIFIADEYANQITAVDAAGRDAGVMTSLPATSLARAMALTGDSLYVPDYVTGDVVRAELRPSVAAGGLTASMRRGTKASMGLIADGFEPAFAVSMGSLPPGLRLDGKTGRIAGTATTVGTYEFDVLITNHWGSGTQRNAITVTP
jgi:hypothetical protein